MTNLQKKILSIIQSRFPIVDRPYADIARQVDSNENKVLASIQELKDEGIIRRIGPIFEANCLGYVSTLVAVQVPQKQVEPFVTDVNALPGVSHNYGREHRFNVWFTLTVPKEETIETTLCDLKTRHGIKEMYSLPAVRRFKINVDFDLSETKSNIKKQTEWKTEPQILEEYQKTLIRALQEDLQVTTEPFQEVANRAGAQQEKVLKQIRQWKQDGTIRRFGASVRHQRIGFAANGMVVFSMPEDRIESAGKQLAQYQQVSHCYQRPKTPGWSYNLFAMTHCRSREELHTMVKEMVEIIHPLEHDILVTTAEYKKTHVKYFLDS